MQIDDPLENLLGNRPVSLIPRLRKLFVACTRLAENVYGNHQVCNTSTNGLRPRLGRNSCQARQLGGSQSLLRWKTALDDRDSHAERPPCMHSFAYDGAIIQRCYHHNKRSWISLPLDRLSLHHSGLSRGLDKGIGRHGSYLQKLPSYHCG
jgi:hypothetical protein